MLRILQRLRRVPFPMPNILRLTRFGEEFQIPVSSRRLNELREFKIGTRYACGLDRYGFEVPEKEEKRIEAILDFKHAMDCLFPGPFKESRVGEAVHALRKSAPHYEGAKIALGNMYASGCGVPFQFLRGTRMIQTGEAEERQRAIYNNGLPSS